MSEEKKLEGIELGDEEIKDVAGGDEYGLETRMKCQDGNCGWFTNWGGNRMEGTYQCTRCKKYTLIGEYTFRNG